MSLGAARSRVAARCRVHPDLSQGRPDRPAGVMHGLRSLAAVAALCAVASADNTSGVDVALYRSSYDTNGVFTIEGARLMPKRDLSFKLITGYAASPLDVAVPGIGGMSGNTGE